MKHHRPTHFLGQENFAVFTEFQDRVFKFLRQSDQSGTICAVDDSPNSSSFTHRKMTSGEVTSSAAASKFTIDGPQFATTHYPSHPEVVV